MVVYKAQSAAQRLLEIAVIAEDQILRPNCENHDDDVKNAQLDLLLFLLALVARQSLQLFLFFFRILLSLTSRHCVCFSFQLVLEWVVSMSGGGKGDAEMGEGGTPGVEVEVRCGSSSDGRRTARAELAGKSRRGGLSSLR